MKLSEPTTVPFRPCGDRDIVVLMSGGVDSSVTALRLLDDGWNVVGVTMLLPNVTDASAESACAAEAEQVCGQLGIAYYLLDVRREFLNLVVEPFREWYCSGRTPSPCVDCNTGLKFGLAWDAAAKLLGVRNLATGHYAMITREDGRCYLSRAADRTRDQSYFLYGLQRDSLAYLRLPLGDITKSDARDMAEKAGLPISRRDDSMELCFAGSGDYREALGDNAARPGPIVDEGGAVIGQHTGLANYTIGQRKGLGIASGKPLFVAAVDPAANTITVADRERLCRHEVEAFRTNVLIPELVSPGQRLFGKVRSQGDPVPCSVADADTGSVRVVFDEPVFAPTPGQRLVLYDQRDRVVVGGVINNSGR